jgi:hypothetical protein
MPTPEPINEYAINDQLIFELDEAFKEWAFFLNNAIGILAFTLALACLGTKTPAINALLAFVVVCSVRHQGHHHFPQKIVDLRAVAKNDPKASILLAGVSQKYFSNKVMITKHPIFVMGFGLLMFVTLSPLIMYIFPFIRDYIGVKNYFF